MNSQFAYLGFSRRRNVRFKNIRECEMTQKRADLMIKVCYNFAHWLIPRYFHINLIYREKFYILLLKSTKPSYKDDERNWKEENIDD